MDDDESGELNQVVFRGRTLNEGQLTVLMEQYKLFVDTSERLVARRQVVNTFFLSANTLVLSALGVLAKEVPGSRVLATGVVAISIAAIVLCAAWKTLVRSYAQLNRGKFAVIDRLEDRLPAALFRAEWTALGKGKDPKLYKPFTHTEVVVSNIFIFIYGLAALVTALWLLWSCL